MSLSIRLFSAILCTFCLVLISACKKDSKELSDTPTIEFRSINPSSVTEYADSIEIVIWYRDGDGDLGENKDGVENLFVTDSRDQITYAFRIPQLAPTGSSIAIQGLIPIQLTNTAITDGSASQSVGYSVYVVDRAGNKSNTVPTSVITVTQ